MTLDQKIPQKFYLILSNKIPEKLFKKFKNKKIYLDHIHPEINKTDILIFPSFYISDSHKKYIDHQGISYFIRQTMHSLEGRIFRCKKKICCKIII